MFASLTFAAFAVAAIAGDATYDEGVRLYQASSYEQAILRFEQVAVRPGLAPADKANALMWLGLSYAGIGDFDAAERNFRFGLSADRTAVIPTEASPTIVDLVERIRAEIAATPIDTPPDDPPPPPPPPPGSGTGSPSPSSASSGLAVVGGAIGAAVGALTLISGGVLALVAADQLAKANDPDAFQDDANDAVNNANATATAASVLIPVGGVIGVAGAVVLALNLE